MIFDLKHLPSEHDYKFNNMCLTDLSDQRLLTQGYTVDSTTNLTVMLCQIWNSKVGPCLENTESESE